MNNLRFGFVGCGRHAKANIYPSVKLAGIKLTSICAKHIENASTVAQQYGNATPYDDYHKMLSKENLDAVFVVLPETMQSSVVIDCLNAGAHVFVEKPLGLNASEAAAVANASAKTGKKVMVGFMKRYAPAYLEMKRFMNDHNAFGDVLSLTGMFVARSFGTEEFFIKNAAIHYVDIIRFILGDIKIVKGFSNSRGEVIDTTFSFEYDNGCIGNMFFAGAPSWARHNEELLVTGINGFVKVENMRRVIAHNAAKDYKPPVPRWQLMDEEDRIITSIDTSSSGGWKDLYLNGYAGEIQNFVDCITNNLELNPSAADNVKTMQFCDDIIKAIQRID